MSLSGMRFLLVLLLLAPLSSAQPVTNAETLDPNDPRAQRASPLVALLAAGELDGAKEYFRAHAAPGADASQIDALRPLLEGGGLQLARLAAGPAGGVLAVLTRAGGGRGARLAVIVELEAAAPHRIRGVRSAQSQTQSQPQPQPGQAIIGTHAVPIAPGSQGKVLPADADHYAAERARQLVRALNQPDQAQAFLDANWDRQAAGETEEEARGHLVSVRERVGEGATLLEVELAGTNEVLARVVNRHGRKSTLTLVIDPAMPHRMYVNGMMRELQEVSVEQATPKRVELATPVVAAPLTFEGGRPFVDVFVEGKGPYRFMVETGFNRIIITPRVIAELGDLVEAENEDMMYRIGDARISSIYKVDELRIGGASLRDLSVNVSPKQPNVDGVLGLSAFAGLLLTVDYPKQQLRLEQGALPEPDGKEIFRTKQVGPFLGVDLTFGRNVIPAIIDTQASSSGGAGLSLTPQVAHLVKFESEPVEYGKALVGQRHESIVTMGRLAGDLKLGRYTFRRPLATVMTFGTEHSDAANLGADFLKHFAMTLDQKNGRVRFAAGGSGVIAAPPSVRKKGKVLVR